MEITDAWLMEMGGWQEMKRARALWQAGTVTGAAFDGTKLTGTVRDQGKDFTCGLLLRSRSDMDNLCTCFQAKRTGSLCAHSLAAGTAWVHRHEKQPAAAAANTSPLQAVAKPPVVPARAPLRRSPDPRAGAFPPPRARLPEGSGRIRQNPEPPAARS